MHRKCYFQANICIAISNQEQIKLVEKWQISLTPKMLIKIHNMLIVFRQVANKKYKKKQNYLRYEKKMLRRYCYSASRGIYC